MASSNSESPRIVKLTKYFHDVLNNRRKLSTSRDGKLFLESICVQADAPTCAHRLISSPSGLSALQASLRFDTSITFLIENTVPVLRYFEAPSLAAIDSGSILNQILLCMVEPPFFWEAFTSSFKNGALDSAGCRGYAWLLLQLVCMPEKLAAPFVLLANMPGTLNPILTSPDGETRIFGQKIKHSLPLDASELHINAEVKPGGRHDNDHADHKKINIMPTADELLSKDRPYLRTAEYLDNPDESSSSRHIDNLFRLLREDMLDGIREEVEILTGSKKGYHKGLGLDNLSLDGVEMGTTAKRLPWGVVLKCEEEFPLLKSIKPGKRKDFLNNNRQILRHGNMACLLIDNEPVAFPTIHRDELKLCMAPARIVVQFANDPTLFYALSKMKTASNIKLVQLDAAVFAYEPFLLRLKDMSKLPLAKDLLHWDENADLDAPELMPDEILGKLEKSLGKDLKGLLSLPKTTILDDSQMYSLRTSLTQRVSIVQGPPGTGKSFIGALVAKVLHDFTSQVILVICFTNHALDQFLEDLLDINIPLDSMVRLGGKSTERTKPLTLREQKTSKLTASQWGDIDKIKSKLLLHETRMKNAFARYQSAKIQNHHLLEYLEFLSDDLPYFEAFSVPQQFDEGMTQVGRKGKAIDKFYLLDRWLRGLPDAGIFKILQPEGASEIWNFPLEARQASRIRWQTAITNDFVTEIKEVGRHFNEEQARLDKIFAERDTAILRSKRIIACTTNGAAKYASGIQSASPKVVLVEEAGEILEAHILTSMGPQTDQLIMIGDHKQLRPKCSYDLSVEKGDGFDLNRSLFERLVLKGFPHVTLSQQHRMRPEISSIIRHFTYPDLTDAASTLNRPDLRGFTDNIIFVHHSQPEIELKAKEIKDGKSSSKQNVFEGQMILKCVRYLAQQGYGSDDLVVLTPYLGQLKLLREQLAAVNDPILNDLDKFDLVRAGLLTDASSKTSKPPLRIATIDNYQGEESDIVLVSLTRSNSSNDIGFMSAPERLNVLISRARNALILIGNSETFIKARKGQALWQKFFDMLKENDHIYNGFPIKCEKHPSRTALLSDPSQFDEQSPDGGCTEPCNILLSCGIHKCPQKCHQLFDHSKIDCKAILTQNCANGHTQAWQCHSKAPLICQTCEREKKALEKKILKDLLAKQKREEKVKKHLKEMEEIQAEIDALGQSMKEQRLDAEQRAVLDQKRLDLAAAKEREARARNLPQNGPPTPQDNSNLLAIQNEKSNQQISVQAPTAKKGGVVKLQEPIKITIEHNESPSQTEWQRQKDQESANNPAIDKIMEMIGLENVKDQILKIKAKVETCTRQGGDLTEERFGLVLLGNPGTGKTTIARLYAKALMDLKVLPGHGFVETTGSRLSHGGVTEVKDHLQQLDKSEGGVYFIDEAYQLTQGHNHGGKPVLDFLLAEIENLVGKVVFLFGGYTKQMEKLFEHNPGFSSRIPYRLDFKDYSDEELLRMLQFKMKRFYKSGIRIEDGGGGLYMRIAVRRLGRGRGREGFGNARALENTFAHIRERQAERIAKERRAGQRPDDFLIKKEDLIGPDPSKAILSCEAWNKLKTLVGLKSIKESLSTMIDMIKTNYLRELEEKPLIEVSLNRVFLGSPGTGKTSVAKLYGQILADIGLLSNGEVVLKNPSDFIGNVIGQSESNTKAILDNSIGKVLIIDEAYMLSPTAGSSGNAGVYKTAVIDTIVAEIQSVPGEDRCVLMLGYEDQMEEMFQNVNPGLSRRFQIREAFRFEDFSDDELQEILLLKLKNLGLGATLPAVKTAIDVLGRARNRLNFGNGGDVENLISKAKGLYQARQSALPMDQRSIDFVFEPQDFDEDFDRTANAEINVKDLFKGVIGCDDIVTKLEGFVKVAKGMRAQGLDPRGSIPMNFIFKGPPGTGKTTTARKFGQVYYDLSFLSEVEVVECSATDLIGQYVGQTGPRTIKQLERGLGKVLFIDEAYRLGEGMFAQEAVNELVDTMTKPKFAGKMVIILAGYENDMNSLLRVNEGLSSRFANEIFFKPLSPEDSLYLLEARLNQFQIAIPFLLNPAPDPEFLDLMSELSIIPSWGNARDVQTLANDITRAAYQSITTSVAQIIVSREAALACFESILSDRRARSISTVPFRPQTTGNVQSSSSNIAPSNLNIPASNNFTIEEDEEEDEEEDGEEDGEVSPTSPPATENIESSRDAEVSDYVWEQLQKDKRLAEYLEMNAKTMVIVQREAQRLAEAAEKVAQKAAIDLQEKQAKNEAEALELLREREAARIQIARAKIEREQIEEDLQKQIDEQARKRQIEAEAQSKLKRMGVCPQGFNWIKQASGYRCGGGSHWVDGSQLN
ncbi:MAG: hypothetical protein M1829_005377 [Trizodia sp. TS-e1964]|nr:MAG: hypothetical protein M1829_005377 [Trizodia sp. TS-e1964]